MTFGVWVEGELGRVQHHPSGHVYFRLKDEEKDAVLDAVMFRREAMRYGKLLAEGARLQLRGRATLYPPQGRLQFVTDSARPVGQGALLVALQKLKERLAAEGLFDAERKRPLPRDPRVVGVVTSKSGAVFSDIVTVSRRRSPVRIVLSAALVQGELAAASLLSALDRLEQLPDLDVIIVGRGGGAREDLAVFNDERVVRRIAACRVPVVSAVGHETDMSLADLVADQRAATPSQAAEMVVPDQSTRRAALAALERHLARATRAAIHAASLDMARMLRRMGDPRLLLAERQQELDELQARLLARKRARLGRERRRWLELQTRLNARHPRAVLMQGRAALGPIEARLHAAMRRGLDQSGGRLSSHARALAALSPLSVVGRGYALVVDENGAAVRDASALRPGDPLDIRVARGRFSARVEKVRADVDSVAAFEHEHSASERDEP
jgi:exodeoxyribonuclease VII large subunit